MTPQVGGWCLLCFVRTRAGIITTGTSTRGGGNCCPTEGQLPCRLLLWAAGQDGSGVLLQLVSYVFSIFLLFTGFLIYRSKGKRGKGRGGV